MMEIHKLPDLEFVFGHSAGVKPEWASFALASTQNLQSAEN